MDGRRNNVKTDAAGQALVAGHEPRARVADTLARALHAAGIRFAFGMPGGEVVTFIDALQHAGIRFVLARNETAAAMMAAGASTLGGAPGLLVTTLGPGLANAVNGIADAAQERVPLIVVAGVAERALRARYTHQIVDHAALLRPLVKASFEIEPEGAGALAARAISLATSAPCGPVHLDLSPSVAVASARHDDVAAVAVHRLRRLDAGDPGVVALRARLQQARRPLVIAGLEALRSGAGPVLRDLVVRHAIPLIATYKAKGIVDEILPLALGGAGLSPAADAILLPLIRAADCVLLAGYDPIEMRAGWLDSLGDGARLCEITEVAADHGMHAPGLRLVAPVGPALEAVFCGLAPRAIWEGGAPAAAKAALAARFAGPQGWGPHRVFEVLQNAIPADAIVTVDSGAHRILLSQRWRARQHSTLLQSSGWCTMGSALPLAIGATLAAPGRAVVAVVGDGGLEMTLGELGTLRDHGLAVVVLVLQDQSLGLIELKQRQAGLARAGVSLGATRFDAVARAFSGHGVAVGDAAALARELAAALARRTFSVISCAISVDDYADAF